ncbi:MAG: quercetin 2,3-dioxygenase, partial [Bdellovibrio sp.]
MLKVRKSQDRGLTQMGWLHSRHSFSFGDYMDEDHIHFRSLRVINEDIVQPGQGFPSHPHRNMEIITYVLSGALEHRDSMGTLSTLRAGDIQRMSAGTGVVHSEYNPSLEEPSHFLQIWIIPSAPGGDPSYLQKSYVSANRNELERLLVASKDGRQGSLSIKQDVDLYLQHWTAKLKHEFTLRAGRGAWIQMVSGRLSVTNRVGQQVGNVETAETVEISAGDGVSVEAGLREELI